MVKKDGGQAGKTTPLATAVVEQEGRYDSASCLGQLEGGTRTMWLASLGTCKEISLSRLRPWTAPVRAKRKFHVRFHTCLQTRHPYLCPWDKIVDKPFVCVSGPLRGVHVGMKRRCKENPGCAP